ncbi:hypothetical protein HF650_06230 [Kosakonia sp. SMBL-WEM22]|uniref:hypothetical protein n=1 Tax=Kosakonia sp. SMBL-WEM22 TaxID=2725560 RepID=UPI0016591831|nr:hypothetical protein [Kosakonia sp. SMBL-WEM22]QNQ19385.1 hypothetical protein HF650_06230 [Kosakonia sp. SMBL-WEM22]
MALPKREYYTLQQAAKKSGCEIEDLLHYAAIGVLQLCVHYEDSNKAGSDCYFYASLSDSLLDELNDNQESFTMHYSSRYNLITMDSNAYFFTAEDGNPCWAEYVNGWFAIAHTELTLPAFEKSKKADVSQLIHPRNNLNTNTEGWDLSTKGFDVSGPCFYEAKSFSSDDFVIMADELDILMNGGMKIDLFSLTDESARIKNVLTKDVGNKTLTSMAKLIKSLLYLCYKDEDIVNNPRKHFDNSQSEINKDFDTLGLKLPSGKTIDKWLRGVDLDKK